MRFTQQDEDKLIRRLKTYGEKELTKFIVQAVAERLMLCASVDHAPPKDAEETVNMMNVLMRAQAVAEEELKARIGMARARAPYVCDLCGERVWSIVQQSRGPNVCLKCWMGTPDASDDMEPYVVEAGKEGSVE